MTNDQWPMANGQWPMESRFTNRESRIAPRAPRMLLEVIVASVADAVAAADGGADRLEVLRDLSRGGLTPPIELVQQIQHAVTLPLRVMVRESDGFTCASDDECRLLVDQAASLAGLGVDGI